MLRATQLLLTCFYAVLPAAMFAWVVLGRHRHRRASRIVSLILLGIAGSAAGACVILVYQRLVGGRTPPAEWFALIHTLFSVLLVLRFIDRISLRLTFAALGVKADSQGRPRDRRHIRGLAGLLIQRLFMVAVTVPYVCGFLWTYRPRTLQPVHDGVVEGRHEMAWFTAQDGTQLFGWWQPADRMPDGLDPDTADRWGQHTVLLCHGVGGGKETQANFARFLNAEGYNVLRFDFRGYGDSGGNWISYGDRERADVLAAATWIKANRAQEAQLLYGIGVNTGAAALLGATAQAQGQFDGLVLIEPFADFDELARTCFARLLPDYARVLAIDLALPVASLHAGADLQRFKPVDWAARAWPSPILVIHGNGLAFVPAYQSMSVFQQASFPKDQFWPSENWSSSRKRIRQAGGDGALLAELFRQWAGVAAGVTEDRGVLHQILRFLETARPVPVL